jgi:hypothetical protein
LFRSQTFFPVQIFHFSASLPFTGNVELGEVLTGRLLKVRVGWKLQRILTLQGTSGILLYKRALLLFDPQLSAENRPAWKNTFLPPEANFTKLTLPFYP